MPYPQQKEQYRKGVQVGFRRRMLGVAPNQFRGHVLHRSPDLAGRVTVDADVVVVANQDIAGGRIEHHIATRDVSVAMPAEMQRPVAVYGLVGNLAQRVETGHRLAPGPDFAQVGETASIDERHQVTELTQPRGCNQVLGPDETTPGGAARRAVVDQVADRGSLILGGLFDVVPLQGLASVSTVDEVNSALPAFTQFFLHHQGSLGRLREDLLTDR